MREYLPEMQQTFICYFDVKIQTLKLNPFPTTGIEIDAWRSCRQKYHILVNRENKELLLA